MVARLKMTNPVTGKTRKVSTFKQLRKLRDQFKKGQPHSIRKLLDQQYLQQTPRFIRRGRRKAAAENERIAELINARREEIDRKRIQNKEGQEVNLIKVNTSEGIEIATPKAAEGLMILEQQKRTKAEQQLASQLEQAKSEGALIKPAGVTSSGEAQISIFRPPEEPGVGPIEIPTENASQVAGGTAGIIDNLRNSFTLAGPPKPDVKVPLVREEVKVEEAGGMSIPGNFFEAVAGTAVRKQSEFLGVRSKAKEIQQSFQEQVAGKFISFASGESILPQQQSDLQIIPPQFTAPASLTAITGLGIAGIVEGGFGTLAIIPQAIKDPVKTGIELINVPQQIASAGQRIAREPVSGITSIGTSAFLLGKGFKAVKAITPRPFKFSIPVQGGRSTRVVGLGIENVRLAKPIISIIKKDSPSIFPAEIQVLGTPKASLKGFKPGSGLALETGIQSKIAQQTLIRQGASSLEARKISLARPILKATQKQTARGGLDLFPESTARIGKKGTQAVKEFAIEQDATIFGSFPQQGQVLPRFIREPVDIDVFVKGTTLEAEGLALQLGKRLELAGERVRIPKSEPTHIETMIGGKFEKAIELKTKEMGMIDALSSDVAGESVFGLKLDQPRTRIEGVKVTALSEQGLRKGASIFTLRKGTSGFKLLPKEHRIKDIGDFFGVQESLIRSRIFPFKKARLLGKLEELKITFPESAVKSSRRILFEPIKVKKSSFFKSTKSPSIIVSSKFKSSPSLFKSTSIIESSAVSSSFSKQSSIVSVSPSISKSMFLSSSPVSISTSPSIISRSPSIRSSSPSIISSSFSSISTSPSPKSSSIVSVSPSSSFYSSKSLFSSSFSKFGSSRTPPSIFRSSSPSKSKSRFKKREPGFNVIMIERRQEVKANRKLLPKREAIRLGRDVADNTVSASYRITKSKTNVPSSRRSKLARGQSPPAKKFRESKSRPGFFVEKRSFRIDTQGEKQGLTVARLISDRLRKMGGFSNGKRTDKVFRFDMGL